MQIIDILDIRAFEGDLSASSKPGSCVNSWALRTGRPKPRPQCLSRNAERAVQSTGIGNGIAMPHGRTEIVNQVIGCIGRSQAGVDFRV